MLDSMPDEGGCDTALWQALLPIGGEAFGAGGRKDWAGGEDKWADVG